MQNGARSNLVEDTWLVAQEQTLGGSRFAVQWKCRSKGYDSEAGKRSERRAQ